MKTISKLGIVAGVAATLVLGAAFAAPATAADGPIITGQTSHTSNGILYYDTHFQGGGHVVNPSETSITAKLKAQAAKDKSQDAAIKAKASAGPKGDTGAAGPVGPAGAAGANGQNGAVGPAGPSGLEGAYYAVAKYDVGDTNGGAIATVACSAQTDVAISGGVQELGLGGASVPVASSFPGRMDWGSNTPIANRLDGWIVQFNTETGAAPQKVSIYALCVPGADVPVTTTYTQSIDG